ncbi:MAG: CBS domain-containing protein [Chloroflexi bacterium]|nr:CBS domain-containing protein [Chloroflexota bacterium]
MNVQDIMSPTVATTSEETSITDAAKIMMEQNVGCLVVMEAGSVYGIITDRDITAGCVAEGHDPRKCKVMKHMSSPVVTIGPGTDLIEASRLMAAKRINRVPVVNLTKLVGIISIADVAKAMQVPMQNLLGNIGLDAPKRAAGAYDR